MTQFKKHFEMMADLNQNAEDMRVLVEAMPESTEKGRILAYLDTLDAAIDTYTGNTFNLYQSLLNLVLEPHK